MRLLLSILKHTCSGGFFYHGEDFGSFHVQDLCNAALHDDEIGVVDVEADTLEQVLNSGLLGTMSIDEIFACAAHDNLPCDADLSILLEAYRAGLLVGVIEDDGDAGLCDTGLPAFVDEILEILGSHGRHVCDAEHEANGVEDVGFARAIKSSDCVEGRIPSRDDSALAVGLEAAWVSRVQLVADIEAFLPIDDKFDDLHLASYALRSTRSATLPGQLVAMSRICRSDTFTFYLNRKAQWWQSCLDVS